jgi:hypothetical protein
MIIMEKTDKGTGATKDADSPKKSETLVRRENTEGKSGIPVSSKEKEARAYGPGKHV